jgi:hypothetical protein
MSKIAQKVCKKIKKLKNQGKGNKSGEKNYIENGM